MDSVGLKRPRSEESPYTLQSKKFVNEKIVNAHDDSKMKEIHGESMVTELSETFLS